MPPHSESSLGQQERRELLARARQAIVEAVVHERIPDFAKPTGRLAEVRNVFVTVRHRGRLRGCVGRLEAGNSLAEGVVHCAICAALQDPRFAPVAQHEVAGLEIEISVLSALFEISPQEIEPGRHGILVRRGSQRGLLLPQVAAELNWSVQRFLEETCRKAGLEPEAWQDPETKLSGFTAEIFSEADFLRRFEPEPSTA